MDMIEYQLASNSDRKISREEFDVAFDVLCSKKQRWKEYPLVADILLSYPYYFKKEHAIVIIYFLQNAAAGRFSFNVKFQEYINSIRKERNKKYNINVKTKSRKFISNSAYVRCILNRKSTIEEYIAMYLKEIKNEQYIRNLFI